jgi:hypothetical protein
MGFFKFPLKKPTQKNPLKKTIQRLKDTASLRGTPLRPANPIAQTKTPSLTCSSAHPKAVVGTFF